MTKHGLAAVLMIFVAMTSRAGINRWTASLEGVAAGEVAIDPADAAVAYTATDAGVFKTTDRGRQWTLVDAFADARTIAINPYDSSNVVAGSLSFERQTFTGTARVRSSHDGGMTWTDAFPAEGETEIVALRFAPSLPATLYAALRNNGIAKSSDGGTTWIRAREGLKCCFPEFLDTEDVAISRGTPPRIYAVSGRGLYHSSDDAVTWHYVPLSPPAAPPEGSWGPPFFDPYNVAVAPSDPARIYVAGSMVPVLPPFRFPTVVSDDGGASWHALPLNFRITHIAVDPRRSTIVYAAVREDQPGTAALLRSLDGGETWVDFSYGLTTADVNHVVVDPSGLLLYASTSDGVYVYEIDDRRRRAVRK